MARSPPMIQTIVRQTIHTHIKKIANNFYSHINPIKILQI